MFQPLYSILGIVSLNSSSNNQENFQIGSQLMKFRHITIPYLNNSPSNIRQKLTCPWSFSLNQGLSVRGQNIFHSGTEATLAAFEVPGPSALYSNFHTASWPYPGGCGRQGYCVHPNTTGPTGSAGWSLLRDQWVSFFSQAWNHSIWNKCIHDSNHGSKHSQTPTLSYPP